MAALLIRIAVGAVLGLTISGAFEVGRSNWRWFFRFIAISCIPFSALGWYLLPRKISRPVIAVDGAKWKRLDLVGSLVMLAAIMLLILGLTQGTSLGFNKAAFIAPTVLSVAMFAAFFVWGGSWIQYSTTALTYNRSLDPCDACADPTSDVAPAELCAPHHPRTLPLCLLVNYPSAISPVSASSVNTAFTNAYLGISNKSRAIHRSNPLSTSYRCA